MQTLRRSPCSDLTNEQLEMLKEVAKMQMGHGLDYDSKIMDKARKRAEKRFRESRRRKEITESELEELEGRQMQEALDKLLGGGGSPEDILEALESDEEGKNLREQLEELTREPQGMTREDFDDVLSEFDRKGLTHPKRPRIALTSKGAQLLGEGFLNRILQRLSRHGVGPHKIQDIGHGPWIASTIRPYEVGDPYERISIEKSLLASLERGGRFGDLRLEDFRTYEAIHSTEVQFGILVDQSASMNRLSRLMRSQFPEDRLRVIAFSEEVREVEPWELPDLVVPIGYTDIRAALRSFRRAVAHESGNKQAHLITDSAPNFEDGEYVSFDQAFPHLLDEARRYRAVGIVLNIVMLDDDPRLREMAKEVAKQNLGRVFFTRPGELGEAVVEDYLTSKREILRF
jgi:uncharacterized protein with von Willebrand factor type A (vWA) domain